MLPLRFVPYHQTSGVANVVVDGSANPDTTLTLSHWPGSPTPLAVRDDLSAQIAFHALDQPHLFDGVGVVTNNHFDQDGLCSAFALTSPQAAVARKDLLIDVASAGDFGTFASRDAARIAFVIAAFENDDRSPLPTEARRGSYEVVCGNLYEEVLPRLPELLADPDRYRKLWETEDAHLDESIAAIESGVVTIEERPDVDLAIVTVPEGWASRSASRFTQRWTEAVHPMAVNNATDRLRILLVHGNRFRLELRYETWVMFTSRPVLARPDLRDLLPRLDELEGAVGRWKADAPSALTPQLSLRADDSAIPCDRFVSEVRAFLASATPAWDPFASR